MSPFERVSLGDRVALLARTRPRLLTLAVELLVAAVAVAVVVSAGRALGLPTPAVAVVVACTYGLYRIPRVDGGASDRLFLQSHEREYPMLPHPRYDTHHLHWTFVSVATVAVAGATLAASTFGGVAVPPPIRLATAGVGALGLVSTSHHFDRAIRVNAAVVVGRRGPLVWDLLARVPAMGGVVTLASLIAGWGPRTFVAHAVAVSVFGSLVVPMTYLTVCRVSMPTADFRDRGRLADLQAAIVRSANPHGTPTWLPPSEVHGGWERGRAAGAEPEKGSGEGAETDSATGAPSPSTASSSARPPTSPHTPSARPTQEATSPERPTQEATPPEKSTPPACRDGSPSSLPAPNAAGTGCEREGEVATVPNPGSPPDAPTSDPLSKPPEPTPDGGTTETWLEAELERIAADGDEAGTPGSPP